jgi:hypothetical protein
LVLGRPVEPGTTLVIKLGDRPGTLATVVHATPYASGSWLVGCQLENPITEGELEALLRQGW